VSSVTSTRYRDLCLTNDIEGFANLDGFPSAQFVVVAGKTRFYCSQYCFLILCMAGQNKLSRPVGGGTVKAGVLKATTGNGTLEQ
jgi:hypothetical protein